MVQKRNKIEILEALRGIAAMYVVFHHITEEGPGYLRYPFIEGQAAVMLFFILSGFVIYYSSYRSLDAGTFKFKDYFIRRFRRIYPVLIVALLVTYISKSIDRNMLVDVGADNLIGNLINLQDLNRLPGMWFGPYQANTPLWSLSYEWWFYMMFFPIFLYVKPQAQKYLALGLSVLGFFTFWLFPNKISITLEYFIIWWTGVEIARTWVANHKIDKPVVRYLAVSYIIMIGLLGLQVLMFDGKLRLEKHPIIELRHFCYAAALLVIGFIWRKTGSWGYKYLLRPFLIFAPISYGIYVFHFPIMSKYHILPIDNKPLYYLVTFAIVVGLSYLVEVLLQNKINLATNKYLQPKRKTTPLEE